jgi:stearoyl-CoA desaturase (delta-9 desaturase)
MVTREWIAIHRKHHARVETADDPHSPQIQGINRIMWLGAWVYHVEADNPETLEKYGMGAPDDWIERNLYTPLTYYGPITMLAIDVALFGLPGLAIWLTQMLWIPLWAAGVINGIGHYWGYRSYEVKDASRNIVPWGILIGGEELHNNHHAYASSARFSVQPWEFDLGWLYIRLLESAGLARIHKTVPRIVAIADGERCDAETVAAVLGNRFQVMANFVGEVITAVWRDEVRKMRKANHDHWDRIRSAKKLLVRDLSRLDHVAMIRLRQVLDLSPRLRTVYQMKERLQDIWTRTPSSAETLRLRLEEWCEAAEQSGIKVLEDFSVQLRSYRLQYA